MNSGTGRTRYQFACIWIDWMHDTALSRVSFGLIAGGAGVCSGDFLRAPSAPGRSGSAG